MNYQELCRRAGITRRQSDYWRERGWIRPRGRAKPGCGARLEWDDTEVDVARAIAAILRARNLEHVTAVVARRVRAGKRGRVRIAPGLILDLNEVCSDPTTGESS